VRSTAVYSAARIGIFLLLAGLGWLVGLRGFLLIVVALVLSLPASWFLLRKQRDAMAADIERKVSSRRTRREDLRAQLRGDDEPTG
jgi:hypothetical protein